MVFIDHLPPGCALWNAIGGDSAWTVQEHLTANAVDALNVANWIAAGGKQSDKPKPLPRPDALLKKRKANEALAEKAEAFKQRAIQAQKFEKLNKE